jgi:hypothetical protein
MVHFDQDWGQKQVEKINLLGKPSSNLISGNITNLLPVWQEFQGNDGVSRIFPATILGLDSVDMRLESEYRNSYVYEEDLFYFSPPKMDSRGMGLVVDVKKTVADDVSGVLGTFKNVYMLKQIEQFVNGKIQAAGKDPLNHIIFNEYGRVIYLPQQTYYTRLLSKLLPDIGIPLSVLLAITMFRHHKSFILIIIIILFLIKLENPLHHTGIVSNNQEPGAVSDSPFPPSRRPPFRRWRGC